MRRAIATVVFSSLAAVVALTVAGSSLAVGPSLPALDGAALSATNGDVSYVTRRDGASTTLQVRAQGETVRTSTLPGAWGIQLATLNGALTGLSPDGRVLVLSDNVQPDGGLRTRTRFAVVDTRALKLTKTISLRGDYSVDALSPKGGLLYLIHHVSKGDATKYQVQAYDLRAGRMLPGVIADKRQAGWLMAGYPVSRAVTGDGGWVYTLYRQDNNYPFVHALDTIHHTAVCVGLPADWRTADAWITSARLTLGDTSLAVTTKDGDTRFVVDTKTFRVSTP